MSTPISQNNGRLRQLWDELNPSQTEYMLNQNLIKWAKIAFKELNILSQLDEGSTDIGRMLREYAQQVHGLDENNVRNIELTYSEAVGFLNWCTNTGQPLEDEQNQIENSNLNQKIDKLQNKSKVSQGRAKLYDDPPEQKPQDRQQKDEDDNQFNENATSNPNQFSLQYINKKYKEYLRIIFQHYCKLTYSTGQDPTFQQIMHKTSIMTINKFMIFCKDFQIQRLGQSINRAYLLELFKKNSLCYKEMSYDMFVAVLQKLAKFVYGSKEEPENEQTQLTPQMVKILQFLGIATSKQFKDKMKVLNIQYRIGRVSTQAKKVPLGYKFKFTTNNGKSQQQMQMELKQRKIHRSERKLMLKQKTNQNQSNSLSKKPVNSQNRKNELNVSGNQGNIDITKDSPNTAMQINRKLIPPIPPAKRPLQISSKIPLDNSVSASANIFRKDTPLGYAQIHKIKAGESYSRKNIHSNKNSRDGHGQYKLNSIVEEAKQIVNEGFDDGEYHRKRVDANDPYSQNTSQSIPTDSRENAKRMKPQEMAKISKKMEIISLKAKKERENQQQLNNLLEMDNDEEDEYLKEHLQREKKNQLIGRRLSNRINQLKDH